MLQININDPEAKLRDVINAAIKGENIVIVTDAGDSIQLVPISSKKRRHAGSAAGLVWMADDFDAPLEDFREYIE